MKTIYCSNCRKKLLTYDGTGSKKYESPLKKCPKCGALYIDPRCHELAAEGIPSAEFSICAYIVLAIFGGFIVWRGGHLLKRVQIGVPDEIQWVMPVVLIILGAICVFGGIIEILLIKTGRKSEKFNRLYEESKERLRNAEYVGLLREHGYNVPDTDL